MKSIFSFLFILGIALVYYFTSSTQNDHQQASHDLQIGYEQDDVSDENLKNLNQYDAIIERPLFVEERQFAEQKKVKVVRKPEPVIEDLKVTALGIALTGDGILAVLKDLKNGKNIRLRIGEEIYGWRLEGVSESSFTFSKDGKEKVIAFKG